MSWTGFKKAVSRATTSVMQSTGNVEKTVDPKFNQEEARYKSLENKVENLYKESRHYNDAARTLCSSQLALAESVVKFYEQGTPISQAASRYKDTAQNIQDNSFHTLNANFDSTVLTPLGKFIGLFPFFTESIRKRNRKLIDYDGTRSKVRKFNERPPDDRTKIDRANEENEYAKQQYEFFNDQLLAEIPKVVEIRGQYVEACFEALVKSQYNFNQDVFISLQSLQQYFPDGQTTTNEGEIEDILQQMRELAICGNH